ncbi:hypothetical protein MRX96_031716 [Rhipicephalus microplus]
MKVLQGSRGPAAITPALFTRRVRWFTRSVRYLYSQNYLEVGVWGSLLAPSYRRNGSSLMMFSGLGFEIARSLVRALDSHGRMLDGKGQPDSRWAQKLKCSLYDAKTRREKRALAGGLRPERDSTGFRGEQFRYAKLFQAPISGVNE